MKIQISKLIGLTAILTMGLALSFHSLKGQTTFTVTANGTPTKINVGWMGGSGIEAHDQSFAVGSTGTACFQPNAISGKIGLIRTLAYPDSHEVTHVPSYFDPNVDAILSVGAAPTFIQYAYPYTASGDTNILMQANGTVGGGTVPTNLVANVRHYLGLDGGHYASNPITTQVWEIGNEPNISVDYLMTKQDYATLFLACHNALLAQSDGQGGTLRDHVLLCGPVTSTDYNAASGNTKSFVDWMLTNTTSNCVAAVDVITYHVYTNGASDDDQLNGQVDEEFDVTSNYYVSTGTQGQSLMLNTIKGDNLTFPRNNNLNYPLTAITEHGTSEMSPDTDVVNGLWNLILTQFFVKNYDTAFNTSFIYGSNTDTYRHFKTNTTTPNFAYWALYFRNNYTGPWVMPYSKSNVPVNSNSKDSLLFLPTLDPNAGYLYVEVINRNTATALPVQTITLSGIGVGAPTAYTLSQTILPNTGTSTLPGGGTFASSGTSATISNCTFPSTSAVVLRFPITNDNEGFETSQGYAVGADVTTQPTGRAGVVWAGTTGLFSVKSGIGSAGTNAIESPSTWSTANSSVSLNLTPATLGVASTTAGVARWSYDLEANYTLGTVATNIWLIRPGRDVTGANTGEPTRFWLRLDGTMTYQDGSTAVPVKTATGSNFVFTKGAWFAVSGIYDYSSKTYTLTVNGVPQRNAAGTSTTINWYQTTADEYGEFSVESVGTTSAGTYGSIALDNVALSVTP